jgi:predicted nuclease with TOPRIM domain
VEGRLTSIEGRMTSLEDRITSVEDRVLSVDTRLTSLEDKVNARLRETQPIWEGVLQRLTGVESELNNLNRQFRSLIADLFQMRVRIETLEDRQPTA